LWQFVRVISAIQYCLSKVHESLKHNHASKFVGCFNLKSRLRVGNWSGLKSLWFYSPISKSAAGLSAI
ncbi:hypothetical protein WKI44_23750, partial [Vibrio alginolyticus]|uniref:hypothetical protein n=1 Tax=Vibrio alginolyticus TaxID=663 RepID=UPI00375104BE